MPRFLGSSIVPLTCLFCAFPLLLPSLVQAQTELILQGGIHSSRLNRPERVYVQEGSFNLQGAEGEATTLGLRGERWFSDRVGLDAGVAWSQNHSLQGGTSQFPPPSFATHIVFTSATIRLRFTRPEAPLGLTLGVGPAVVFHGGTGTSQLERQTDIGGVITASARVGLSSRVAIRLDAQEYLFNSSFASSYTPPFVGDPIQPAGSRFRHEFVILMGLSYRLR